MSFVKDFFSTCTTRSISKFLKGEINGSRQDDLSHCQREINSY